LREIGSGVEPGREQVGGSGGEESALEFPGDVSAAFRARFGAPGGTKGDHTTEDEPVAAVLIKVISGSGAVIRDHGRSPSKQGATCGHPTN